MGIFVDDTVLERWAKELLKAKPKNEDEAQNFLFSYVMSVF